MSERLIPWSRRCALAIPLRNHSADLGRLEAVRAANGSQRHQPPPDSTRPSQEPLAGQRLPVRLSPTVTDSPEPAKLPYGRGHWFKSSTAHYFENLFRLWKPKDSQKSDGSSVLLTVEDRVHRGGARLDDGPELMPVDLLMTIVDLCPTGSAIFSIDTSLSLRIGTNVCHSSRGVQSSPIASRLGDSAERSPDVARGERRSGRSLAQDGDA